MSCWNAKYKNDYGEYEINFSSKDYEKARAVEKVCCAVMDKYVKTPFDVEVVVRCRECVGLPFWEKGHNDVPVCLLSGLYVKSEDDFCPYGERKEGTDNEP